MSVWADIHRRSNGALIRKEDIMKVIIPRSNFGDVMLLGIPCNVIPESDDGFVTEVVSTITGMHYDLKTEWCDEWCDEYTSLTEANKHTMIKGSERPVLDSIIGKKYWPRDNSYIIDVSNPDDKWIDLYKKECEIVSTPFKSNRWYIKVKHDKKNYFVPFHEWFMTKPTIIRVK